MNALQLLTHDHDVVRGLFEEFRAAAESEDTSRMAELAETIFHELDVHTTIEEQVFYPAIRDAGGGDLNELTDESREEHHVVDLLAEEARGLSTSDAAFKAKMTVMMENVEHHASEEEDEMFPEVEQLMTAQQLDDLGRRLEDEKRRIASELMSKDELYAAAKEKGVEGRSTMTKDELADAVTDND